jgi:hypothetical protein
MMKPSDAIVGRPVLPSARCPARRFAAALVPLRID